MMLATTVARLERLFFDRRALTLVVLLCFTAAMAWFAVQLRMDAGFEKQMPSGHEYIKTFQEYRNDLLGANRLNIVVKARNGTIWTKRSLAKLYDVTQAVIFLPNIERLGVQSLWTPNSFVNEITEDGFRADPLIDGTIPPEQLTPTAENASVTSALVYPRSVAAVSTPQAPWLKVVLAVQ
jgi:predicted RND superfamily exporter protein